MEKKKQERAIEILIKNGFKEVESHSKKYRVMRHPSISKNFYIGKKGAIRFGFSISDSISLTSRFYKNFGI